MAATTATIVLPDWPRGMNKRVACAYLGLSKSRFEAEVEPAVVSIKLTARVCIWVRDDLDAWLDRRRNTVSVSGSENPWDEAM